jgi:hypothetical protein
VTHPGGNIDVYCYRSGANCDGAWTGRLQWKAVTDAAHLGNGSYWTERVDYSYRQDGTLTVENSRDSVENSRDSSDSGGATR